MANPLDEARYELALANRIIAHEGVLDGFGHVSMRHPVDSSRYLLARSRSPELIEPADILEFTLDSEPVAAAGVTLYGERVIHGCIYQARPDVNAVCHHHSPSVLPFCITGTELVPVFHMGAVLGTAAPFWDSRDEFGDTNMLVVKPEEGQSLARALGSHWMVLMRRHGATLVGTTLRELVFRTIYSHANAEIQLRSMAARQDRSLEPRRSRAFRSASAAAASHGAGLGILDRAPQEERRAAAAAGCPCQSAGQKDQSFAPGSRVLNALAVAQLRCRPAALDLDALDHLGDDATERQAEPQSSASPSTMRMSFSAQGIGNRSIWVCNAQFDALLSTSAVRRRSRSTPRACASLKPSKFAEMHDHRIMLFTILPTWPAPRSPRWKMLLAKLCSAALAGIEGSDIAADHHQQLAGLGGRLAARDRHVQQHDTGAGQAGSEPRHGARRNRRRNADEQPGRAAAAMPSEPRMTASASLSKPTTTMMKSLACASARGLSAIGDAGLLRFTARALDRYRIRSPRNPLCADGEPSVAPSCRARRYRRDE